MNTVTVQLLDGSSVTFEPYIYTNEDRQEPKPPRGLGQLAVQPGEFEGVKFWRWYYKAPGIPWRCISARFSTSPNPPPLPQPRENWSKCGCGTAHVCPGCGQPYFIEIHGCADGYCTYCYYRG